MNSTQPFQPARKSIPLRRALASASFLLLFLLTFLAPQQVVEAQTDKDDPIPIGNFVQNTIDKNQAKLVKVFGAGVGNVDAFSTGIIVSEDGKILTSQGVYLDGRQVRVVMANGTAHVATILQRDRDRQLALLQIPQKTPDFFELETKPVGKKGDWVIAICNAFKVADKDEPISATLGVISLRTQIEARLTKRDVAYVGELVLIDAITSNPGAAGGAVLTADGKLVGIVGKIINSSETNTRLNYAVPNQILAQFVAGTLLTQKDTEVAEKEPVEFGIVLFKLGGRNTPAYVERVKRGSPAAEAKLQPDDMIISLDGNRIGNNKDFEAALANLVPDEEILMIIKRDREILRIRIAPREKK